MQRLANAERQIKISDSVDEFIISDNNYVITAIPPFSVGKDINISIIRNFDNLIFKANFYYDKNKLKELVFKISKKINNIFIDNGSPQIKTSNQLEIKSSLGRTSKIAYIGEENKYPVGLIPNDALVTKLTGYRFSYKKQWGILSNIPNFSSEKYDISSGSIESGVEYNSKFLFTNKAHLNKFKNKWNGYIIQNN